MPLNIPEYIEIKTAAGATAAYLSPEADGLKDVWVDNKLNGRCTLSLSLPLPGQQKSTPFMTEKGVMPEVSAPESKWRYLSNFYRIYAPDITGSMREFVIQNPDAIEKKREGKKLWGKITAHESWVLLGKKYADPGISNDSQTPTPPALSVAILSGGSDLSGGQYTPGGAGHALYAILQGTGWSVGTVDVTGTHDLETEKKSVLANIKQIQKTWGGYLIWDSINKTVSLRDEEVWAPYTGYQVKYAKNLKSITRTEDHSVITKLYPFGKDDLDISSVNGGKLHIEDYSFTDEELTEIWTNQDIEDPRELLDEATKYLEQKYRPRYNYKVKQVDRRIQSGFQHEDFDIGHLVDIVDEELIQEFNLSYDEGHRYDTGLFYADWFRNQTRIIGYKHNVFQPWRGEIEVGDPVEEIDAMLQQSRSAAKYLDKIKNSKEQISGYTLVDESLISQKIAKAAVDVTKLNTKVIILLDDEWADSDPSGGSVSWNQHNLYYAGQEHIIQAGNTAQKYIYWDGAANTYSTSATEPSLGDGQFIIAVNNGGLHDTVWDKGYAREFIGSAFIANAAILSTHIGDAQIIDAHIANLSANKITAGILDAARVQVGMDSNFESGYDPSTKETPTGAQQKADQAEYNAETYADTQVTNHDNQSSPHNLPSYTVMTSDGIKVFDDLDQLRVWLGQYAAGKYGVKIVDGEIFSSLIRTGLEADTTYVALVPGGGIEAYRDGNLIFQLRPDYPHGYVDFYDTGSKRLTVSGKTGDCQVNALDYLTVKGVGMKVNSSSTLDLYAGVDINAYAEDDINLTAVDQVVINAGDEIYLDAAVRTLVQGDFRATGTLTAGDKQCYEETSQGVVGLYTRESPDVRYIDEGRAELVNGHCIIDLLAIDPPLYPECVEGESGQTMWHVQLTPMGPFTPYVVEINSLDSYIAVASKEPEVNGKFTWTLSATRKGKAGVRFPRMEWLVGGNEESDPVLQSDWEDELLMGVE